MNQHIKSLRHELKNQLAIVKGYAQLLKKNENVAEQAGKIEKASTKMEQLLDDLKS